MFAGDALFQTICESPDDDGLRLMYADWLEEHGNSTRAEFIRVQIEMALPGANPRLEMRLRALEKHELIWRQELPRLAGITWGPFVRGFVASAVVERWRYFRHQTHQLWGATPLEHLTFTSLGMEQMVRLFEQPELARLQSLWLATVTPLNRVLELFRAARPLRGLHELTIADLDYFRATRRHPFHRLTVAEVRPLLTFPQLERLQRFRLIGYAMPQGTRDALQQRLGERIDLDLCATVIGGQ